MRDAACRYLRFRGSTVPARTQEKMRTPDVRECWRGLPRCESGNLYLTQEVARCPAPVEAYLRLIHGAQRMRRILPDVQVPA